MYLQTLDIGDQAHLHRNIRAVEAEQAGRQLATLLTWSAGEPLGLEISLTFDHDGSLELAEIIRCDPREVLYSLEPNNFGAVTLAGAYARRCEFDSVEAALGRVLELDDDADRPD
jgi:hypothetical protein